MIVWVGQIRAGRTYIDDGYGALVGPGPGGPQPVDGPHGGIDAAGEVLVVLFGEMGVLLEVVEKILVGAIGDIEGRRGRGGRVVALGEDIVGRLEQHVAEELGAKVDDVGQMRVLEQRCRGGRVANGAGLGLSKDAVGDGVAHDAGQIVLWDARGGGQVLEGDARAERDKVW